MNPKDSPDIHQNPYEKVAHTLNGHHNYITQAIERISDAAADKDNPENISIDREALLHVLNRSLEGTEIAQALIDSLSAKETGRMPGDQEGSQEF